MKEKTRKKRAVAVPNQKEAGRQTPAATRGVRLGILIILVAINLAVFAPVRNHDFVNFDDPEYVTDNSVVKKGLTLDGVAWAITTPYAANWHPLTWLSHMLDIELSGLDAGRHHVTSVFLHICSTLLLFGLLHRMTGALWRSAFVAALFAIHPLHVESVAWISERKDVLSALFWMLTLWAYLIYVRRPRVISYIAVCVALALGLMAKPMLVTLPFTLLLLDVWPLSRTRFEWTGLLRLAKEKIPLFAIVAASSVVTFLVQKRVTAVVGLQSISMSRRIANVSVSYVAYAARMLWPAKLSVFYPYPSSIPAAAWFFAALVLVAMSLVAIRAVVRYPYLTIGWFWFIGTLVPVIGIVQVGSQAMADRYTYIPLIGLFIIVAWGIPDLLMKWASAKLVLPASAGIAIALLAFTANAQVQYWQDSNTLWEHALSIDPENAQAHHNLGFALAKQGKFDLAIPHYSEAIRIYPKFLDAHLALGEALENQGRPDQALAEYREAIRIKPDYWAGYGDLARLFAGQGKLDEAIAQYSEALRLDPGNAATHYNLGNVLARSRKFEEAVQQYSEALRIDSLYYMAHNSMGNVRTEQGNFDEARKQYREALRINPGLAQAHLNLGILLAMQDKVDEAIVELNEALRINPGYAAVHTNLGILLAKAGKLDEADRHFTEALRLNPGDSRARAALENLKHR